MYSYDGGAATIAHLARTLATPSPSREFTGRPRLLMVSFRGSYDSNAELRIGRPQRRRCRGHGGSRGRRGSVRTESVLVHDADGARADRPARAQALQLLR